MGVVPKSFSYWWFRFFLWWCGEGGVVPKSI